MKILDEAGFAVYMVGGGGLGLSHQTDGHAYVLDGHGELALIDAGSGIRPELIGRNLEQDGIEAKQIATIIVTHSHWDHARGCAHWKRVAGAKVACHVAGVHTLEQTLWPDVHITKHGISSSPCKVDTHLHDGSRIRVGKLEVEVLHTPGHSVDGICLFAAFRQHRLLFSGDTVFAEGGHGTVTADTDFKQYRDSVKRIVTYKSTALFPGHRQFVLRDANEHVRLLEKKLCGQWTDIAAARVPFFPTWWLEHDPKLYDDAKSH